MRGEKLPYLEMGFKAEGEHFWEHAQLIPGELADVKRGQQVEWFFMEQGAFSIMPAIVEVQAFQIVHPDSFRNIGIGWADDYVNHMTQPAKLARQVIEVNPLPATVFIPPIAQETYFHPYLLLLY
jgi:hypothetical protein